MCEKENSKFIPTIDFKEQTPAQQITRVQQSELYKKAWLENDSGVSDGYVQNTSAWD
ncbi:MAG: hypothetical protein ACI4GC_02780 [Acutalibacteraceae bacterium]